MKTLSLLQPWASLVVGGHKTIETRSWSTKYRGPLLIHASKKFTGAQLKLSCDFANLLQSDHFVGGFGAIIGQVQLLDVFTTEYIKRQYEDSEGYLIFYHEETRPVKIHDYEGKDMDVELAFGDYSSGRFGWLLSNPVLFKEPIPAKGSLGLWTPDAEDVHLIIQQIEKSKP